MPNFLQNVLSKAASIVFPARGGYGGGGGFGYGMPVVHLPGSQLNYAALAGSLWENSVVSIALGWIATNFPEPDLQITRMGKDGTRTPIPNHPLVELIQNPNDFYTGDDLWAGTMLSYWTDGNAYWLKVRDGLRDVRELWYIPHWLIRPQWTDKGFIDRYLYFPRGTPIEIPAEDVVHFRFMLDPKSFGRYGTCPLKMQLRGIVADNEGETYTASLLRNSGVPAVSLTPLPIKTAAGEVFPQIDKGSSETIQDMWVARFTGDNRGRPFVPTSPMAVEKIGFSPEELALDRILNRPEMRITAAMNLSCMVLGLPASEGTKTYANYQESRTAAYEDNIKPSQRKCGRVMDKSLLTEWNQKDPNVRVEWDYSRVLPEDRDKLSLRVVNEKKAGIWTINESRKQLDSNSKPLPDGDEREPIPSPVTSGGEETDEPSKTPSGDPGKNFRVAYAMKMNGRRLAFEREELMNGDGH